MEPYTNAQTTLPVYADNSFAANTRLVLNSGYIKLVDHMGNDTRVAQAARASYDSDDIAGIDSLKDAKLIDYLVKHYHTSPLEHVHFTFEVKAPLFVLRQWMRHRTWKYSEVSGRYAKIEEDFYIPDVDKITTQHVSNKQMRTDIQHPEAVWQRYIMESTCKHSYKQYEEMLQDGVPRELARTVLPLAMYSRMFATVDLHNLCKFLQNRLHEHAQYEIKVFAQAIKDLILPIVPSTMTSVQTHWIKN